MSWTYISSLDEYDKQVTKDTSTPERYTFKRYMYFKPDQYDNWSKVMSEDGIIGYVKNNAISDVTNILNKANSAADKALTAEQRITNFLERYINRVIVSIANNGFYQVLQPILLLDNDGAVNRIVSGATLKAGEVKVIPTTVTNELLAPVYKKYIAVVAGGKVEGKLLTNGDAGFKNQTITLSKGENTIVYAAVDFYGNQIVKRYTVTAE